jgi:hypothetical protein
MNPLQAMVASRQANKMSPIGVQSQGAAPAINPLQYAQMNTPLQPQMMNAPAARLQEMDKQKYINAALDRDFKEKQLAFQTMSAADDRRNRMAVEAERAKNNMALEGQRQTNVLDAQDRAKIIALETEKQKFEMARDQQAILQQATDERYGPFAEVASKAFGAYNQWIGGGQEQARTNLVKSRTQQLALSTISYEQMAETWKNNPQFAGMAVPEYGSEQHINYIVGELQKTEEGQKQIAQIMQMVDAEIAQKSKEIVSAYNSSLTTAQKLGFTVPSMSEPDIDPSGGLGTISTLPDASMLPSLAKKDKDDGKGKKDNKKKSALKPEWYEENYNPKKKETKTERKKRLQDEYNESGGGMGFPFAP